MDDRNSGSVLRMSWESPQNQMSLCGVERNRSTIQTRVRMSFGATGSGSFNYCISTNFRLEINFHYIRYLYDDRGHEITKACTKLKLFSKRSG